MTTQTAPKVFLSHASEDKERFVLNFAKKLREKGIDVWLDKWEMLIGDSLIDKIFEEGIKNAQAIIVVLSKNSVNKVWVREELNAAVVKKINGASKIIPVLIDDCEVPEALKSTLWIKINDLNNYETELSKIIDAILENRNKPALGKLPSYATTILDSIPNLTKIDSLVLKLACEEANKRGHSFVSPDSFLEEAKALDIPEEDFYDSLEVLDSRGYIKGHKVFDRTNRIKSLNINIFGYDEYAQTYLENYPEIIKSVIAEIVNLDKTDSLEIASSLNQQVRVINHILEILESQGLIRFLKLSGGDNKILVRSYTPELKRKIRD
jgi:hypothetical protein